MRLCRVEEWTKGKAPFPALLSAWLVINADMIYGSLKGQVSHTGYANLFSVQDFEVWSRLYQDLFDEPTMEKAFQLFSHIPIVQALPSLKEELMNIGSLNDLHRPAIANWIKTYFLHDFNIELDGSSDEQRLREIGPIFESPFIVFTFKIFVPCMVYYQATPGMLLKQALRGHIESLARLLQLDKNFLSIPEIKAVWEPISRNTENADFKMLSRAIANSPHTRLRPSRVKTAIAVGIEALFEGMRGGITRPAIRDLFDSYARDTKRAEIDTDLPATEDAFDAAIRREKNRWKSALSVTP